uniref:Uncharacterized protein n=1 Tax=Oryza brachyantha TaxID=4533 RepID=J3LMX8_ORYBR
MVPDARGVGGEAHEIVEVVGEPSTPSSTMRLMDFIPIYIPTVERGALSQSVRKRRFLDFLRAHPSRDWFLRSTFVGRLRRRGQAASGEDDEAGVSDGGRRPRRRFRVPFVRKIKWGKLWSYAVSWCRKPENFAMIIWLAFVAAGLLMLFMLMTGMLDGAIPDDERRKKWTEVINQILNALFTIMCLYQHPKIFHHLVLLLRWRPGAGGDREEVRKVYCKDGAPRPRDRAHMLVVVALLHATCLAQYFCCALFWSYARTDRPDWALNIGYGLGTGCPVIAGLYAAYGPLGRKQHQHDDPEAESSAEVRTANFYDVEDDRFVFHGARNEDGRAVLVPLPREASTATTHSRSLSCPPKIDAVAALNGENPLDLQMAAINMERVLGLDLFRPDKVLGDGKGLLRIGLQQNEP